MSAPFKTIFEYLHPEKKKKFVIPNYQRGYKWAVKYPASKGLNHPSAVEQLLCDILKARELKNDSYFIQGITVSEIDNDIVLIDGQQRTTTIYLLLWYLDRKHIESIDLEYNIRQRSKEFIAGLKDITFEEFCAQEEAYGNKNKGEQNQDIHYFKEAIGQIHAILKDVDRQSLYEFIMHHVNILYINIDPNKATNTFTMMNGSKATMRTEELVKAEVLRMVSIPQRVNKDVSTSVEQNLVDLKEIIAKDWETNALRSRYAREWDKWLYWWNQEGVRETFSVENPMGLLLEYYFRGKSQDDRNVKFGFDNFKELLKSNLDAKRCFKELRDLQKSFEHIYDDPIIYNYLGLSLIGIGDDKFNTISHFIKYKHDIRTLANFAKWRIVGATYLEITIDDPDKLKTPQVAKERRAELALDNLSRKMVYKAEGDGVARKYLLYLNVIEDCKLDNGKGRKFDFSIYNDQSLEHIHPKSKAYHYRDEDGRYYNGNEKELGITLPAGGCWLNRDACAENVSEHSIGNLVLLDKSENSKFKDGDFEQKKAIYFDITEDFKSRNLLHTISVFANSKWNEAAIAKNQEVVLSRFESDYNIKRN